MACAIVRFTRRQQPLGLQLLAQDPSVWLETNAEITNAALAIMRSDCDSGLIHATRALHLSEQSGRAAARRASLANLGNLSYAVGRFDEAIDYFERAMAALPSFGDNCNAALDSIARVRLVQDRVGQAGELLDRIAGSVRVPGDRRAYVYRHAQLTVTQLLARQKRWTDALASADALIQLASDAGDHLLRQIALLTKAELLQQVGKAREAMETLDIVVDTLAQQPPQISTRTTNASSPARWPAKATATRPRCISSAPGASTRDPQRPWSRRALSPLERDDDTPRRE